MRSDFKLHQVPLKRWCSHNMPSYRHKTKILQNKYMTRAKNEFVCKENHGKEYLYSFARMDQFFLS